MPAATGLAGLLILFLVLTPLAGASTYEVWMDGLYDADFDGDLLAGQSGSRGHVEDATRTSTSPPPSPPFRPVSRRRSSARSSRPSRSSPVTTVASRGRRSSSPNRTSAVA